MSTVDCVMLAYSKDESLRKITQECISSLHASTKDYVFNVILVETEPSPVSYTGAAVIHPCKPFNYNEYLNIGLERCKSEYVIIANNDLVFHPGWFEEIVKVGSDSASPWTDGYKPHENRKNLIMEGYRTCFDLCGWCIVVKKSALDKIGKFDEQFDYWCQDDDYCIQLRKHGLKHNFVGTSWVTHLLSKTQHLIKKEELYNMTHGAIAKFENKYRK